MKKIIMMLASLLLLCGCSQKKENDEAAKKILVLYYSQTGATKQVAEELQKELNADIEEIQMVTPYDSDFQKTIERCQSEMADNSYPEIKDIKSKIDDYDIVFLGYPIWFGNAALPVLSFVQKYDLSKVKLVTFCTFGSGGIDTGNKSLEKLSKAKLDISVSYGVRNARLKAVPAEVKYFLTANGFIQGDYEKKADYSALKDVTEKEVDIFKKACGDYPMLHAVPQRFGTRTTNEGNDYFFEANDSTANGPQPVKVLVSVNYENNLVPEFTEVIR